MREMREDVINALQKMVDDDIVGAQVTFKPTDEEMSKFPQLTYRTSKGLHFVVNYVKVEEHKRRRERGI